MTANQPIKLGFISCGLGRVNRGFEVSTARWFKALEHENGLDVRLFCGGKYPGGNFVWNLHRDSLLAGPLAYIPFVSERQRWELCYGIEQISFALCLLPELIRWKPDVLWTKEAPLAHLLYAFRLLFNLSYKIIFANGGAFKPNTYQQFDFIQHLQQDSFAEGVKFGIPTSKMTTLCNFVPFVQISQNRSQLRQSFGYSDDDWIVVCVAAWNSYHKRIDYLINEVAAIDDPKLRVLLCGHPDIGTDALKRLAGEKLNGKVRWLTLSDDQIRQALYISDLFVLPSLEECLGGSLIEAAMTALPIVTHPHPGARFILKDEFWMADLSKPGNLSSRLLEFKRNPPSMERLSSLQREIIERFDETTATADFLSMLDKVVCPKPEHTQILDNS